MSLTKTGYRKRIIDTQIQNNLLTFGAICLEGPKWSGKTWTALNHATSACYIASPENNFQYRTMAQLSPDLVLNGESPRLLDEWQEVPALWDAVRFSVDQTQQKGQFILTGSSTPNQKGVLHSGTGRIVKMRMRSMSLFESGDSSGSISLKDLFSNPLEAHKTGEVLLDQLISLTIRGGWPGSLELSLKMAAEIPKAYIKNIIEEDIRRVDGIQRNTRKLMLLLRSIARNESTVVSNQTLLRDMKEDTGDSINVDTVSDYLNALDRLFILEDQLAFTPNIRSSIRVGKSAKRHFSDPSLAVALLGASPERLKNDLNTFGFLFESLCTRDLRIYAESFGAQLLHYRDASGREIDAVIELPDGKWGAFEIKLGANQIDEAANNLIAIKKFMEANSMAKAPEILCVICGLTNIAYTRADGVMVLPITALKP